MKTSVELDTQLRAIQKKFDDEVEEQRWLVSNPGLPKRPPRGQVKILATDVDDQGNWWVVKFLNEWGAVCTKKTGEWQYIGRGNYHRIAKRK
jgi:hypothetical protein